MGWSSLRALAHKYGFTEAEAKAVVFIAAAALTGAVYGFRSDSERSFNVSDAYRISDSIFAARAAELPAEPNVAIPSKEGSSVSVQVRNNGRIDINTASQNELEELPGIGPVIAGRIIAYRTQNDGFHTLDDLLKVKSIGKKKFEQLEPYICIGE